MCGIAGIIDLKSDRPVAVDVVQLMTRTLTSRGPDGEGFHFEPGVGLGHRRLSIIDLEGGKQPLANEDGRVIVTYNGEIYNFRELEQELVACGHVFRTRCDTEVIVHAWEEWGEACVNRFNGMFAFAIWDARQQVAFLARDRIGIKPLHYALLADGRLVFGSELKALYACPDLPRDLDVTAVEDYFAFGYVPDPKTIHSGVKKLAPGHYLKLKRGSVHVSPRQYWDVPLYVPPTDISGGEGDLVANLKAAVVRRLIADVPLGAFLSGGIDSSAIVAMMREAGVDHLLTCSIGFHEPRYDESEYADIVAACKRTDHKRGLVGASEFGLLDKLVGIYDEPFADSSAIPTYRVCELMRRHVTVALSGDGGDENFIGYRRYRLFALEERLRSSLPLGFRRAIFGPLGRHYPKLDWAPRVVRGKTTFEALARDSAAAYLHGVSLTSESMRRSLFSKDLMRELDGYSASETFSRHLEGKAFSDPLRMIQYLDFKTYLPGDILTKVDRASMAHGLEVRVPFLDHSFVEWAAALPTNVKLRRLETKYVLKKSLERLLPRAVLYRSKMGFAVPLDTWFRGSLKDRIADTVGGSTLRQCGLFNAESLDRVLSEHQDGRRDHSSTLWSLLMFEGFLRRSTGAP